MFSHCVWLYFRFPLSFREVEELMFQRGVIVSYETVRRRCAKSGQAYADGLRRRRPQFEDKGHLDEVFIKVSGESTYLWRAVGQDGSVLDVLARSRRDKAAARRFLRRLMKKTRSVPRVVVTDRLRSCGATHREAMPSVEHRQSKYLNNQAENSHQPTRRRGRNGLNTDQNHKPSRPDTPSDAHNVTTPADSWPFRASQLAAGERHIRVTGAVCVKYAVMTGAAVLLLPRRG
ncbi:IS6 family transposase [Streptomyces sp. NPDC018972]|uniref:IS6 family transposase n=1 Tax=Streptomyces sp. NPDC018972 TaxID=3365060 RepID=UPI0037A081A2